MSLAAKSEPSSWLKLISPSPSVTGPMSVKIRRTAGSASRPAPGAGRRGRASHGGRSRTWITVAMRMEAA